MTSESNPGPRIPHLAPEDWGDAERAAVAKLSESLSRLGLDGNIEALANLPNVLKTLLRHPALMAVYFPLAQYLLNDGLLDGRSRELLILRTAWLRNSEYEWAQHVLKGRQANIGDAEIKRIAVGSAAEGWSEYDQLLLTAVEELVDQARMTDGTWDALALYLDREQMMELVFTVGAYDMAAMAFNSFGLQLDQGLPGFAETT